MFCPSRLFGAADTTGHRTATPRDVPGSRLLAAHRAAMLQSGSPPGGGGPLNPRRVCNPSVRLPHPSCALAFLGYSSSSSNPCKRSARVSERCAFPLRPIAPQITADRQDAISARVTQGRKISALGYYLLPLGGRFVGQNCLLHGGLGSRAAKSRVGHAVFAGFQMAGQPFLESRIGLGFDGHIVPAGEPFQ
jgi:hypothetical protein